MASMDWVTYPKRKYVEILTSGVLECGLTGIRILLIWPSSEEVISVNTSPLSLSKKGRLRHRDKEDSV